MVEQDVIKEETVSFLMIQYRKVLEYLQQMAEDNWRLKKVKNTSMYFERGYKVRYSYCMIPVELFNREIQIKARQQDWRQIGTWKHLLIFGKEEQNAMPIIEEDILHQYIKNTRYRKYDLYIVLSCFLVSIGLLALALYFVLHAGSFIKYFFITLLWGGLSIYHLWVLLHVCHILWKPEHIEKQSIDEAKFTMRAIHENMMLGVIASVLILIVG